MDEAGIPVNYIAACSGASLVAAAYACGTLPEFKERIFNLSSEELKQYLKRNGDVGGVFSIDLLEDEIRKYTKGLKFEDVRPLMGFVAVDIESGEKVLLSMGDVARAARISCTLPGVFTPVKWGGRTLVDGGLLTMVPGDFLRQAQVDVTIGVDMRGTRHIFTDKQITLKRIINFFKKVLLLDSLDSLINKIFGEEEYDGFKSPKLFEVLGKSLDLAILANKKNDVEAEACDLTIVPDAKKLKDIRFTPQSMRFYYERGRETGKQYAPKIKEVIKSKG